MDSAEHRHLENYNGQWRQKPNRKPIKTLNQFKEFLANYKYILILKQIFFRYIGAYSKL